MYMLKKSAQPVSRVSYPLNRGQTTLLVNTALCLGFNRRGLSVIAGYLLCKLKQLTVFSSKVSLHMKRSLICEGAFGVHCLLY